MSKTAFKAYIKELTKEQLEEQIEDLYDRFKEVKTFYDFAFNPKEDKRIDEAKAKISKEYFPTSRRRPKKRRSVAQKYVRHFLQLGMEPSLVVDLILFHIEVAQTYDAEHLIKQEAFHKAMYKSAEQALKLCAEHGVYPEFSDRFDAIVDHAGRYSWINAREFYILAGNEF
jgi:hypothetical protein